MNFRAAFISRRAVATAIIGIACVAAAGAATVHTLAVGQATGSNGATAFVQTASSSSALQGEVASSANTAIKIPFGVLGEYNATGGPFGIGVAGISTTGYAVGAESFGAAPAAIALGETSGDGIDAFATGAGNGVVGSSASGMGVVAIGTSGQSASIGAQGSMPALAAMTPTAGTDLFDAFIAVQGVYYPSFQIKYPSTSTSASINDSDGVDVHAYGDLYVGGNIYASCGANESGCGIHVSSEERTSDGRSVAAYGSQSASPTIEDSGEAQLVNGFAHVSLDPIFARTISLAKPYLVFATPQADSNGLYVTHRTQTGFDVRESKGGRSALAFDYRIVAEAYGKPSQRMTYVEAHGARRPAPAAVQRAFGALRRTPDLVSRVR